MNLWLQFDTNSSNTIVGGDVHRHPNSNYENFQDNLDVTIAKLSETSSKYYICGDFNNRDTIFQQIFTKYNT